MMLVNLFCFIASLSVVECRSRYANEHKYKAYLRGDSRSPTNAVRKVEKTRNFSVEDIQLMSKKVCSSKVCSICDRILSRYETIKQSHLRICEMALSECCSGPPRRTRF